MLTKRSLLYQHLCFEILVLQAAGITIKCMYFIFFGNNYLASIRLDTHWHMLPKSFIKKMPAYDHMLIDILFIYVNNYLGC